LDPKEEVTQFGEIKRVVPKNLEGGEGCGKVNKTVTKALYISVGKT